MQYVLLSSIYPCPQNLSVRMVYSHPHFMSIFTSVVVVLKSKSCWWLNEGNIMNGRAGVPIDVLRGMGGFGKKNIGNYPFLRLKLLNYLMV
ncbi:hypothetical protein CDL12_11062 [Handroanthus impetiginosus]|uniref:Uncharacterized protein n=1 Tax=Handroanthus impetiginosus TaxID=429701 RepID=A0A2G9HFI4_9LAMI|nr:hypothetical protein CDL12_11062 [Handroanthus impetiginosus]